MSTRTLSFQFIAHDMGGPVTLVVEAEKFEESKAALEAMPGVGNVQEVEQA